MEAPTHPQLKKKVEALKSLLKPLWDKLNQTKEAPNGVKLYIYTEIQPILFINFWN